MGLGPSGMLDMCSPHSAPPPRMCRWTKKPLPSVTPVDMLPVCPGARRRALIIGINYTGQGSAISLDGCANDATRMRDFLAQRRPMWETDPDHMRLLINEEATRSRIIEGMKWLCHGAVPGDSLFFFFAGHGSQTPDLDGDEEDGLDETILPVDFRDPRGGGGHIVDDIMWEIMVKPLPAGCRLTAVMDCCHSGTGMDLPYGLVTTREDWRRYQNGETPEHVSLQPLSELEVKMRSSCGDVLLISGCCDDQTSSDSSDIQAEFQSQWPQLFNCGRQQPADDDEEEQMREWYREQARDDLAALPPDRRPPQHRDAGSADLAGTLDDEGSWLDGIIGGKKSDDDAYTERKDRKVRLGQGAGPGPPGVILGKVGPDGRRMQAKSGGALTTAFTVLMNKWETEGVTWDKLLYGIREVLEKCNFDQKPQLSGSRPFMTTCPVEL